MEGEGGKRRERKEMRTGDGSRNCRAVFEFDRD